MVRSCFNEVTGRHIITPVAPEEPEPCAVCDPGTELPLYADLTFSGAWSFPQQLRCSSLQCDNFFNTWRLTRVTGPEDPPNPCSYFLLHTEGGSCYWWFQLEIFDAVTQLNWIARVGQELPVFNNAVATYQAFNAFDGKDCSTLVKNNYDSLSTAAAPFDCDNADFFNENVFLSNVILTDV